MPRRPHLIRTLSLLALPALLAVPLVSTRAAPALARPHATVHVVLRNFAFSPQTITVAPGTTVVWTQQDHEPHTVTSDSQAWPDSGELAPGQTVSHTFTTAGTCTYHCAVHPNMTARIVVSTSPTRTGSGTSTRFGHSALIAAHPAQVLVTGQGMTLYLYSLDTRNKSACTGACAAAWPPVLLPAGVSTPPILPGVGGTFSSTARPDGTRQLTYGGAPLYTFVKDKKPGDMNGQGLGGIWWAVVALPATVRADDDRAQDRNDDQATSTPVGAVSPTPAGYYGGRSSNDHHGGSGHGRTGTPTPTGAYSRGRVLLMARTCPAEDAGRRSRMHRVAGGQHP